MIFRAFTRRIYLVLLVSTFVLFVCFSARVCAKATLQVGCCCFNIYYFLNGNFESEKRKKKKEAVKRRKPSSSMQAGILQIIFARRYLRVTTIHIDGTLFSARFTYGIYSIVLRIYNKSRIFFPYCIRWYARRFSFFFLLL